MSAASFIKGFKSVAPALAVMLIVALAVVPTMRVAMPDIVYEAAAMDAVDGEIAEVGEAPIFINKQAKKEEAADKAPKLPTLSTDLSKCADGTYTGTGRGYAGDITVKVVIKSHVIKSIKITKVEADDPPYMAKAKRVIGYILKAQSLDVDTVSGATYSSNGIISAVGDALDKAMGKPSKKKPKKEKKETEEGEPFDDNAKFKDGTYAGVGMGYNDEIHVSVTILNGAISAIDVTKHGEDEPYMGSAMALIASIINAQSVNVDTVTGATYSSRGIINAVKDALRKAVLTEDPELGAPEDGAVPGKEEELPNADIPLEEDPGSDEELVPGTYMDGTYTGLARGYKSTFKATVIIVDGSITNITIAQDDDAEYYSQCVGIIGRIIENQTTEGIDTVSGCTLSSNGILNSVKSALSKAKKPDPPAEEEKDKDGNDEGKDDGSKDENGGNENTEPDTVAASAKDKAGEDDNEGDSIKPDAMPAVIKDDEGEDGGDEDGEDDNSDSGGIQ